MKMKFLVTLILIFELVSVFGQEKKSMNIAFNDSLRNAIHKSMDYKENPVFRFDNDTSEYLCSKTYLDPENIESVSVLKSIDSKVLSVSYGPILIKSKNPKRVWITLTKLKSEINYDTIQPLLFVINGALVNDTIGVRVEASTIIGVEILKITQEEATKFDRTPSTTVIIRTKLSDERKSNAR